MKKNFLTIPLVAILAFLFFAAYNTDNNWDGFVYPNKNDLFNDIHIGTFKSLEICRQIATDLIDSNLQRFPNPDYECGKNCKGDSRPFVCEVTAR